MASHLQVGKQLGDDAAAAGDLLMDAPEHESFEHLVELAHDKKAWNKHIRENILKVTARDRAMSEAAERAAANVHGDWLWSESRQMVSKFLKQQRYAEETALQLAEMPVGSLLCYTDGGCDGNGAGGVRGAAGWGAQIRRSGERRGWAEQEYTVLAELWGPIVTVQADSPMFYLGAREGTNNTGELVGIAQALLWMRNDGGDEPAAILYDSEYAAKVTAGVYSPKKNLTLAEVCQRLYREENARRAGGVRFIHVKGHSGDSGNDRADLLVQWGKGEGPYCRISLASDSEAERTAREAIWRKRLREEEEKEERGRATRGGTADAVEDSTGPAGSERLPDDSVEVFLGDSGLSWVASSRGGGAVRLRASPIQCARAASVRPVAPETAERGQPSNVLL